MNKPSPYLYLLMRNDLPSLNPGKLAAQAAHGANQFVGDIHKHKRSKFLMGMYKEWQSEAAHFGVTIVLSASISSINSVVEFVNNDWYDKAAAGCVIDPSYPCDIPAEVADYLATHEDLSSVTLGQTAGKGFMLREEVTGAFVFSNKNDPVMDRLMSKFSLYP